MKRLLSSVCVLCLLFPVFMVGSVSAQSKKEKLRSSDQEEKYEVDDRFEHWRSIRGNSTELERAIEKFKVLSGRKDYVPGLRSTNSPQEYFQKAGSQFATMQQLPTPTPGNQFSYPTVITLPNGDMVMAYKDWGEFIGFFDPIVIQPSRIYITRSMDDGATWSAPVSIAEGDFLLDFNFLQMNRLGSGRLFLSDLTPFEDDHAFYSDDDGQTWISVTPLELFSPGVFGPVSGNIWQTHVNQTNGAVIYRTSADGITWSGDKTILTNPNHNDYSQSAVGVVEGEEGGDVIAFIQRFNFNTFTSEILQVTSTDDGNTWSAPTNVTVPGPDANISSVEKAPNGTIWIAGQASGAFDPNNPFLYQPDVFYTTSSDFGANWAAPQIFTTYKLGDVLPSLTFNDAGPFLAFQSERIFPGGIFYGIPGTTVDSDAPPGVLPWFVSFEQFFEDTIVETSHAIDAVSGISQAELRVTIDGNETTTPMVKGGDACSASFDPLAEAVCWTGPVGPFSVGSDITIEVRATDGDGRVGSWGPMPVGVIPVHDAGNLFAPISPEGYIYAINWPGSDGDNYMCCGSTWIGHATSNGVVSSDGTEFFWGPDPAFTPSSGPGESNQDIAIGYTDVGSPIGVDVVQRSYQWSDTALENGIVFEYEYTNNGGVGNISQLFAGLHLDADLVNGNLFWDDLIAYSPTDNVIYMWDAGTECVINAIDCPSGYIGIGILADPAAGKNSTALLSPYTATWNLWEKDAYDILTEGINGALTTGVPVAANDYRMMLTAQPFDLNIGASAKVVFGVVIAGSYGEMVATMNSLDSAYEQRVVSTEPLAELGIPTEFNLRQNYPNPFNPVTTIRFDLPASADVDLSVFDMLGRRVSTVANGVYPAGSYSASFDASGLSSGTYIYRLQTPGKTITGKMLLLK